MGGIEVGQVEHAAVPEGEYVVALLGILFEDIEACDREFVGPAGEAEGETYEKAEEFREQKMEQASLSRQAEARRRQSGGLSVAHEVLRG